MVVSELLGCRHAGKHGKKHLSEHIIYPINNGIDQKIKTFKNSKVYMFYCDIIYREY
jgi:hypothetical protein